AWRPAAWCRGHLLLPQSPPAVLHRLRSTQSVSHRPCRGRWDCGQSDPPQASLAHRSVGGLPFPIDAAQFVTGRQYQSPDALEDAALDPALERAMDRAIVRQVAGQLVPLTATAQAKNDRVECRALVNPFAPGRLGRVVL